MRAFLPILLFPALALAQSWGQGTPIPEGTTEAQWCQAEISTVEKYRSLLDAGVSRETLATWEAREEECRRGYQMKIADRDARLRSRAEDAERETTVAKKVAELKKDPANLAAVWSLHLCAAEQGRADALEQVKAEKESGKLGGVVDLRTLHQWQDEAYSFQKDAERARAALKALRRKPIRCTDRFIEGALPCVDPDAGHAPGCHTPESEAFVALYREVDEQ